MEYEFLLAELEEVLGPGTKKSKDNHAFCCPFCNENRPEKKKLEVQLKTDSEGKNPWECWVCKTKGGTIYNLLRKLSTPKATIQNILKYVPRGRFFNFKEDSTNKPVILPKESQELATASNSSYVANNIKNYLYSRNFTDRDFTKYQIKYCTTGDYANRIIFPSYDETGRLNYFVGRTFTNDRRRYRNPEAVQDTVIFYENLINWDIPVVLCEGVFDAIAIKRNAVPVLGSKLPERLKQKLVESGVDVVYLAFDSDTKKLTMQFCTELLHLGKRPHLVKLKGDPSQEGFDQATQAIKSAQEITLKNLIKLKLDLL